MTNRILVVDDDDGLRRLLTLRLQSAGYEVTAADSGESACAVLGEADPHMVITDLRMPGIDGHELMLEIQQRIPDLPVMILTAHGDIPDAVRATRAGAAEFLTKPVGAEFLDRVHHHLQKRMPEDVSGFSGIVTRSPGLRDVLRQARRVAKLDSAVLVNGPSGTGKELLARGIHEASSRAGKPLVTINCAAVPAELLESELFGHRKGAFTGAAYDHPGLFRSAQGGTVFLDEIGDMPHPLQSKLLRVLQEREVRPVGDLRAIPIDVRVISATHRDLPACIAAGTFREDLYYRLNVVQMQLPALADRREDIPLLVEQCLAQLFAAGSPRRHMSAAAMDLLLAAPWPGNVRQLFNVVEHTVALAERRVIDAASVRRTLGSPDTGLGSLDQERNRFMREYLQRILTLAEGNISRAARLAQRNRTDLYKLMNRYGVNYSSASAADSD